MTDDGVPDKYKLAVRDFTRGSVSLESMVKERTPQADSKNADFPTPNRRANTRRSLLDRRVDDNKNQNDKVSG